MRALVDGVEYDIPELDDLDMDETILLEQVSGVGIEQLDGDNTPMGAVKALVMIAVMRGNPLATRKDLEGSIGKIKLRELGNVLEGADARPPVTPPEPGSSTRTSGDDSTTDSSNTPDANHPPGSGLRRLPTSATSDQKTSAA